MCLAWCCIGWKRATWWIISCLMRLWVPGSCTAKTSTPKDTMLKLYWCKERTASGSCSPNWLLKNQPLMLILISLKNLLLGLQSLTKLEMQAWCRFCFHLMNQVPIPRPHQPSSIHSTAKSGIPSKSITRQTRHKHWNTPFWIWKSTKAMQEIKL